MILNSLGVNTSTKIITTIENGDTYSEEEKVVGTWIDGKPIYRVVISGFTGSDIDVTELQIDHLVSATGFFEEYEGYFAPLSTYWGSSYNATFMYNNGFIQTNATSGYLNKALTLTLEYTKTTDEPVEANTYFGDVYSTEETRVGTWIDGKPMYRTCVFFTSPGGTSEAHVYDVSGYNIESLIDIRGAVQISSAFMMPVNTTYYVSMWYAEGLVMKLGSTNYANKPAYAVIEYTKTTDEATVSTTALMDSYDEGVNEA